MMIFLFKNKCVLFFFTFCIIGNVYCDDNDLVIEKVNEAEKLIKRVYPGKVAEKKARQKLEAIAFGEGSDDRKIKRLKSYIKFLKKKDSGATDNETAVSDKLKLDFLKRLFGGNGESGNGKRTKSIMQSLVMIDGRNKSGSGFVACAGKKKIVITSGHLLLGNSNFTLYDIDNNPVDYERVYFSTKSDLAVLWLPDDNTLPALKLKDNINDVPIGCSVSIYGSKGNRYSRRSGKLLGVGNTKLDTSVSMSSESIGGPIIDDDTNEVIGISSTVFQKNSDSLLDEEDDYKIYSFGTRVDNLNPKQFQRARKKSVKQDIKRYRNLAEVNADIIAFLNQLVGLKKDYQVSWYHCMQELEAHDLVANESAVCNDWRDKLRRNGYYCSPNIVGIIQGLKKMCDKATEACSLNQPDVAYIKRLVKQKISENVFLENQLEDIEDLLEEGTSYTSRQNSRNYVRKGYTGTGRYGESFVNLDRRYYCPKCNYSTYRRRSYSSTRGETTSTPSCPHCKCTLSSYSYGSRSSTSRVGGSLLGGGGISGR